MTFSPGNTILLRCVDKRYQVRPEVCQLLPTEVYKFTYPGASLGLQNEAFRQAFLDGLRALESVGVPVGEIVLVDHFCTAGDHGCKAYGLDDSQATHEKNLRTAVDIIHADPDFAHIPVKLLLHDIDANVVLEIPAPEAVVASGNPLATLRGVAQSA